MENSLDAGAARIDVRLDNGGQALIRVQDDGCGIPADELELSVTRHATSKIASMDDLERIRSYGFRGEAAEPSLRSRASASCPPAGARATKARPIAWKWSTARLLASSPAALHKGTIVEVRDLFSNIPARLKFLKTPATEFKRAQDWLARPGPGPGGSGLQSAFRRSRGSALSARPDLARPPGPALAPLDRGGSASL